MAGGWTEPATEAPGFHSLLAPATLAISLHSVTAPFVTSFRHRPVFPWVELRAGGALRICALLPADQLAPATDWSAENFSGVFRNAARLFSEAKK